MENVLVLVWGKNNSSLFNRTFAYRVGGFLVWFGWGFFHYSII